MSDTRNYPGGSSSPVQVIDLAHEYRRAAHLLCQLGRRRKPASRAPCRLSAIHAIELYLNALLLHWGHEHSEIRGMQHDLAQRAAPAVAGGLQLRRQTAAHLAAMVDRREYVITRYGAELTATVSQINRLLATLEEVAKKVTEAVERPARRHSA